MAINRQTREDLMREATVYTRRLMMQHLQSRATIFVGLRLRGGWSIYFGEDPVFQFNSAGKLRRVHFSEQNYAAEDGKLYLLERSRAGGRVEVQRTYSAVAQLQIVEDCRQRLMETVESIRNKRVEVVELFPAADFELETLVFQLLQTAANDLQIASAANA